MSVMSLNLLPSHSNARLDKGFIGEVWQADWSRQGVHVWATQRENQKIQNPLKFDRLLNSVRERIEEAFDILKGGRSVEHILTRTIGGPCSRILAKIVSGTLRLYLRRFFGIDVLTYTISA